MNKLYLQDVKLIQNQVISYLKNQIPNNSLIYAHNCPPYFFQETLEDNQYRATIILNGSDCYYVAIHIGDINDFDNTIDFTLLKQIEI
jgi:hypothetical protein